MKTVILFVFGLLTWLLLTNFQVVYSKVASFTSPAQETTEEIITQEVSIDSIESSTSAKVIALEDLPEISNTADTTTDTIDLAQIEIKNNSSDYASSDDDGILGDEAAGIDTENAVDKAPVLNTQLTENPDILAEVTKEEVIDTVSETQTNSQTESNNNAISENDITQENITEISTEDTKAVEVADSSAPSEPQSSFNPGMQQPHQANKGMVPYNMMNPMMMNPGMFMNPMAMMTPMMINMMAPMMNPAMMMNPNAMLNHPINTMTQPQNLNTMMMTMDPNMLFSMFGQPSKEYLEREVPDQLPVVKIPGMPTQTFDNWPVNKVSPGVSREAKKNAFQTAMALSPLSMRDMMGIMAEKMPVNEDVSWDDAIEAMKLRANEVNFKFVGSSKLWKEIEAVTGEPSAKVEMFRFCDASVARKILDVVPEFIVFLPCKIALMEDGEGKLWVMTMDWDVSWLDYSQNPNSHLAKDIREDAQKIRDSMRYIMEGAATGEF